MQSLQWFWCLLTWNRILLWAKQAISCKKLQNCNKENFNILASKATCSKATIVRDIRCIILSLLTGNSATKHWVKGNRKWPLFCHSSSSHDYRYSTSTVLNSHSKFSRSSLISICKSSPFPIKQRDEIFVKARANSLRILLSFVPVTTWATL